MPDSAADVISVERRQAISDCLAAERACLDAVEYLRGQGRERGDGGMLEILRQCTDACRRTAASLERPVEPDTRLGEQCATLCTRVAQGLADAMDAPPLRACSEACLRCASSLKKVVAPPSAISYDKVDASSFPASDPPATIGGDLDVRTDPPPRR